MSLFSALCMFSWVLPQALKEIAGVFSRDRLDARLHRRGVVAQHMQAGTESDDLDLHLLAEVLVVLRDVGRVVEREVHHRRFVGVHLQDEAMRLLVSDGPLATVGVAASCFLSPAPPTAARRRAAPTTTRRRCQHTFPNLVIMYLL